MEILQGRPTREQLADLGMPDAAADTMGDVALRPNVVESVEAGPVALRVDRVEASMLVVFRAAWADLCTRVVEPNVFLDPAFVLPLLQHVAVARRPSFLLVWEESGPVFGRLVGLVPVHLGRRRPVIGAVARGFDHMLTSCGMPLVDRRRAEDVLGAVLDWLAEEGDQDVLTLSGLAADGPFAAALAAACTRSLRTPHVLESRERAILVPPGVGGERIASLASAKRRKEHARQRRRLSEAGRRTYASARLPAEIEAATERFLALENRGWKGTRGTSLLADPKAATFARTMMRLMARRGLCRIDAIEIDGHPVAMGVILTAGDRAFFWKTTFDETYGMLSPGVQFTAELTQAQLADAHVAMTDSCAIAGHPMIDRLWPHRMTVVDLMVALEPGESRRARVCRWAEHCRRSLRQRAKTLRASLRRRRADRGD